MFAARQAEQRLSFFQRMRPLHNRSKRREILPNPKQYFTQQGYTHLSTPTPDLQNNLILTGKPIITTDDTEVVLRNLAQSYNKNGPKPFDDVLVVAMQHMLKTTVPVFKVMKKFGLKDAVIGGKSYSNHDDSIQEIKDLGFTFVESTPQIGYGECSDSIRDTTCAMWMKAIELAKEKRYKAVLIYDDGGDLILSTRGEFFPGPGKQPKWKPGDVHLPGIVMGIEQTSSGLVNPRIKSRLFPIINYAGSLLKKAEYPYVAEAAAEAAIEKVKHQIPNPRKLTIGILGYGIMGKAIEDIFVKLRYNVLCYDPKMTKISKNNKSDFALSAKNLLEQADVIIGCTGTDVTADKDCLNALLNAETEKWLVSTGSKDNEFNTLLNHIASSSKTPHQRQDPLQDIEYTNTANKKLNIIKGGFPINFNNEPHSVDPEHIWMTRAGMLLSGFMCTNAIEVFPETLQNCADQLSLDAEAQLMIMEQRWLHYPDEPILMPVKKMSNERRKIEYITNESCGSPIWPKIKKSERSDVKEAYSFRFFPKKVEDPVNLSVDYSQQNDSLLGRMDL